MALAELRDRLAGAFEQLRETSMMDETALNGCLNEITCALLDADLPRCLVNEMESKSQRIINLPPACNKGKLIYQVTAINYIDSCNLMSFLDLIWNRFRLC